MGKQRAARRQADRGSSNKEATRVIEGGADATSRLDRVIHQPVRLAIVSSLAVNEMLTFNQIKALLRVSDGNLSVHARKLEDAGYIDCDKGYAGRLPRTEYRLTGQGRTALQRYLEHMESLIHAVRLS